MNAVAWILANWRLVAFAALVFAVFVQTVRLGDAELEVVTLQGVVAAVKAVGEEAEKRRDAIQAQHQLIMEEAEHDLNEERATRDRERAERSARFDSLYRKYYGLLDAIDDPGRGVVSGAGESTVVVVQPGEVCFDRVAFADGVRGSLDALRRDVQRIVDAGQDALIDRAAWASWARLVGSCEMAEKVGLRPGFALPEGRGITGQPAVGGSTDARGISVPLPGPTTPAQEQPPAR